MRGASVPPHLVDDRDPPAIALLKEDHQILRALFGAVKSVREDVLFPVAGEICIRLTIHMNLEEEFFYPSVSRVVEAEDVDDAILEHRRTERLISEIMDMNRRDGAFRAKVCALGNELIRHFEEEDRLLLRDARKAWEDCRIDLDEVGLRMHGRRRELFGLVRSVAEETRGFDLDLAADAVVRLPQTGLILDGQPWRERADALANGRRYPAPWKNSG
jgi:hemerythrin superfamily protein